MEHPIELEIRAEIPVANIPKMQKSLALLGKAKKPKKRLSVMMFGEVAKTPLDIRIRVTNGECEVVSKAGVFGSHNRTEASSRVLPEEFINTVKVFSQFNFYTKIGARIHLDFILENHVTVTIARADHIAYVELEKMSSSTSEERDKLELEELAKKLDLKLINSEEEFQKLVTRLNNEVDWLFHHTEEDYKKLTKQLKDFLT